MSKFDTEYTLEPICPFCGTEVHDAWELFDLGIGYNDPEVECDNCSGEFTITREIEVAYYTFAIKKEAMS